MNVRLAVLADYANVTGDGKLNILGIFDRINLLQIPAVHPQMHLVLRIEAHPSGIGVLVDSTEGSCRNIELEALEIHAALEVGIELREGRDMTIRGCALRMEDVASEWPAIMSSARHVTIDGGHTPFYDAPDAVADVLAQTAQPS